MTNTRAARRTAVPAARLPRAAGRRAPTSGLSPARSVAPARDACGGARNVATT